MVMARVAGQAEATRDPCGSVYGSFEMIHRGGGGADSRSVRH